MADTSSPAISIQGLSKAYRLGVREEAADTLVETAARWVRSPLSNWKRLRSLNTFSAQDGADDILWALKDVSFDVAPGEVIGVIGRNGAGKSTLLKILSRITEPTGGRAVVRGRVASLLEVGTGFHNELSGRENVYMNGVILGMKKREIDAKFDEIVDFSGIERFLDTPIKRYSSGMKVRLAFAVAAHLEPEILIIDEVLAVGDADFRKKCLGKMEHVARDGRTVLFVSHNMQAVTTLTSRSIVLSHGEVHFDGLTAEAVRRYDGLNLHPDLEFNAAPDPDKARIVHISLRTSEPLNIHRNRHPMSVHLRINAPSAVRNARLVVRLQDEHDRPVVRAALFDSETEFCRIAGEHVATCEFPDLRLAMGRYTITAFLAGSREEGKIHEVTHVCPFEVVMYGQQRQIPWAPGMCVYTEDSSWTVDSAGMDTSSAALPRAQS